MIRSHLVRALYRDLLGPQKGTNEVIEEPFLQYQVGILNSAHLGMSSTGATLERTGADNINPDTADVDEESVPNQREMSRLVAGEERAPESFRQEVDTDLSFALGTVSLGLHFVLKGKSPTFKVCLTWARYEMRDDLGSFPRMFERHPNHFTTKWISSDGGELKYELSESTSGDSVTKRGAWLYILPKKISDANLWIVRVFMVNKTPFVQRQKESDRIFQPQIRVIADGESELASLDSDQSTTDGEGEIDGDALLYFKSRTKARGHMCAAVWRDVDPEIDSSGEIGGLSWPDGRSIPSNVRNEFTCPLVRTEYLPLYTVLQPNPSNLTFDAGVLSDTWDPDCVERELAKITASFSEWICKEGEKIDDGGFPPRLKDAARKHLEECRDTNSRIVAGIDFLKTSEKARAAFCFMNAVMNDKWRSETGEGSLKWREFQMAFMLQSLRGVSGDSEEERELAEVLWFPTGGGKTEAYLGVMIFALAYRRLTPPTTHSTDGGVTVISRYTLRLLTIQQFQRTLGAIVAADVRRVENWLPEGAKRGDHALTDSYMRERLDDGMLWGGHRFSIGLWIGGDATPNDFAYIKIKNGKVLLNCEGALLPMYHELRKYCDAKGDPAQIQECPVCKNILCMAKEYASGQTVKITWIIKSQKSISDLASIPREHFENLEVSVRKNPAFDTIDELPDGNHFYRLTAELAPKKRSGRLERETVDNWWKDTAVPALAGEGDADPIQSTSASMPGYFFLSTDGAPRPHDFAIYCTNKECKLGRTEWFETLEGAHTPLTPEPFRTTKGRSRSVPISAYTTDEQIYLKCPSVILSTVDKFANLPFEPKCASLFGNVDAIHPHYGYGRKVAFESPLTKMRSNKKAAIPQAELKTVPGFAPPSLILQDELHLIEGPLGSMVGIYEMAVDVLSGGVSTPKYIASSATIKEAKSQVGTIFRRGVRRFPPPGIESSGGYFSKVDQDVRCASDCPGRLYIGVATTKSTVTLPIRIQSTVMSEIFKIKSHPEAYGLSEGGEADLESTVDPYWTFVTYFTDLQLMSKFNNYYDEDVTNNVTSWSATKSYNSLERAPPIEVPQGMRLFKVRADYKMKISAVSVYCVKPPTIPKYNNSAEKDSGVDNSVSSGVNSNSDKNGHADGTKNIMVALYRDGDPAGEIAMRSEPREWKTGEIVFDFDGDQLEVAKGESVWVAVVNSANVTFQAVKSHQNCNLDYNGAMPTTPEEFPVLLEKANNHQGSSIMVSINERARQLDGSKNLRLSSATSSEELAHSLEVLKAKFSVDSLQTSPVFGTGIDIDRLGIMTVMNQPKTNSGYIQATGRVGRTNPGLVISWLRAGRARDLNHYENFIGYHTMLHRFVEPVTASPFSLKSTRLCIGPLLVSLLRNARSVQGKKINECWTSPDTGPLLMSRHGDAAEIASIKDALTDISQSKFVPQYRKMRSTEFGRLFDEAKAAWRTLATSIEKSGGGLQYAERKPNALPEHNVVLGTPRHDDQKLERCYENVPNSLRQTELTSSFHNHDDIVAIRPSQFITKYGPGSLIHGKSVTWVVPDVGGLVKSLKKNPHFSSPDTQGQIELKKYEIKDNQMRRILHRLNPNVEWSNLKLFQLPSNTSLALPDLEKLYECGTVSTWGICHNSNHYSKVLGKIVYQGGKRVVMCPECEKVSGNPESRKFYSVRYLVACKKGHMGDLDWPREVHQGGKCKGDVFEWRVSGSNDNVEIICLKCGKSTNHVELTARSNSGQIRCDGQFAESGRIHQCEKINGKSHAKMVSKGLMSLRLPIIMTTLKIPGYKGILSEYYESIAPSLDTYIDMNNGYTKEGLLSWMDRQRENKKRGFTHKLVELTKKHSDAEIREAVEHIKKITTVNGQKEESMTELESLGEELSSLENQTRDMGTGAQIGTSAPPPDNRFPIKFRVGNLRFEAMPFNDIRVTQVQTGYTREIPSPADGMRDEGDAGSDIARTGESVRSSSRYKDASDDVWHVANQLIGEGIFIHLDPAAHRSADEIFAGGSKSHVSWAEIHGQTKQRNVATIKTLGDVDGMEQTVDTLSMEIVHTHPLFVWWHTFAHELVNQLAIDSGFTGTSLGERVYCIERSDGQYAAGLLIYAVSPGADGTLGGLTSLVDKAVLPEIAKKTLNKTRVCSVDPLCADTPVHRRKLHGAACHVCLMNSETSCAYQNKFLDRNVVMGEARTNAPGNC